MTSTVERRKRRIGWSARAFKDLVWPSFACEFPGELMPMESVADSHFAKILDMRAGIDAWLLLPKSGPVRGIASRVQPAPPSRPWNTFTVRMSRPGARRPQEFERWQAADSTIGAISSHYVVQAYVTPCVRHPSERPTSKWCNSDCVAGQSLISAAIVQRADLMTAVERRVGREQTNSEDGVIFWCTPWQGDWHGGRIAVRGVAA